MLYLWEIYDCPDKYYAEYDTKISPDYLSLRHGIKLSVEDFSQCDCYIRAKTLDLPDDPFIIFQLRHVYHSAYIFTPKELFFCDTGIVTKITITEERLNQLRKALLLTSEDIDIGPIALTDEQLETIFTFEECPKFSRIPILQLTAKKEELQKKYDSIPNNSTAPLVNQKIMDLLLELAPEDVQFLDAKIQCKDAVLTDYKLLNVTHKIIGIDRDKSIYSTFENSDDIRRIKYLTYKSGCMKNHKLARDADYLGHLLVTEEIKLAFEREQIKGPNFIKPEDYYSQFIGGR